MCWQIASYDVVRALRTCRRARSLKRESEKMGASLGASLKKYDDDFLLAGTLPKIDADLVEKNGLKSVLYIVDEGEATFSSSRKGEVEGLGLGYKHIAVSPAKVTTELANSLYDALDELPKPCLVECASGRRAGAVIGLYDARKNKLSADDLEKKSEQLGLSYLSAPVLKQWVFHNL